MLSLVLVLLPAPNSVDGGMGGIWLYTSVDEFSLPKEHTVGGVKTEWKYEGLTVDALKAAYEKRQGLEFKDLDAQDIKHTITESRPDQGGGKVETKSRYWSDGRLDRVLNPDQSLTEYRYYGSANIANKGEVTPQVEGYLYQVAQTSEQDKTIASDISGLSADKLLVTTTTRDVFGRVTGTVDPMGVGTITEFDGLGRVKRTVGAPVAGVTQPMQPVVAGSSAADLREEVTLGDDAYNGYGSVKKHTRLVPVLSGSFNSRPTITRQSDGGLVSSTGSVAYQRQTVTTEMTRDAVDRVTTVKRRHFGKDVTEETHYKAGTDLVDWTKDIYGTYTLFEYDTLGRRNRIVVGASSATDSSPTSARVDHRAERTEFDARGLPLKKFVDYGGDAAGEILEEEYVHDGFGRLVQTTATVTGQVSMRAFDAQGRLTAEEALSGSGKVIKQVRYDYDPASGALALTKDVLRDAAVGHLEQESTALTATTDPSGRTTAAWQDGAGRPVAQWSGLGAVPTTADGANAGLVTAYLTDRRGLVLATSTGRNLATARGHFGGASTATTPDYSGTAPWQWYNAARQPIRSRTPELDNGSKRAQTDAIPSGFGVPSLEVDAAGNNLHRFFDAGDVLTQRQDGTDGTQRVTAFAADPAKRLTMVVKKGTFGGGALASRSTGDEVTITESDRLGRVIKTVVSSSSDPAFQVNGGNIDTSLALIAGATGVTNRTSATTYDYLGRVEKLTREDGSVVTYLFVAGNRPDVDARRQVERMSVDLIVVREFKDYDCFGQPGTITEFAPDGWKVIVGQQRYAGTAPDALPDGVPQPTAADFGQVIAETTTILNGSGVTVGVTRDVRWGYDATGKRAWMRSPSGVLTTYSYADEAYLTEASRTGGGAPAGQVFKVTLDPDFKLPVSEARWMGKASLTYRHDAGPHLGIMDRVKLGSTPVASYGFDHRGLLVNEAQWPQGSEDAWTRFHEYDGLGQPTAHKAGPGSVFGDEILPVDVFGYRTGDTTIDGKAVKYTRGANHRIEKVSSGSWADLQGTNADGTPMSAGSGERTFTYDTRQQMKSDGVLTLSWDAQDRMQSAVVDNYATYTVQYVYDGLGRRVYRLEQRPRGGGYFGLRSVGVHLSYDGDQLIEETDVTNGSLIRRTTWGAAGAPIAVESRTFSTDVWGSHPTDSYGTWYGDTKPYILVTGADGSVVGVLDGADGAVLEKLVYNAGGLARSATVEAGPALRGSRYVPYAWQGRFLEPITNRLWNGKDFDPLHGQQLNGDPGYNPDIDRTMQQLNGVLVGMVMMPAALEVAAGAGAWASAAAGGKGLLAGAAGLTAESIVGAGFGAFEGGITTKSWEGAGWGAVGGAVMPGVGRGIGWGAGKALQGGAWAGREAWGAGLRFASGFGEGWQGGSLLEKGAMYSFSGTGLIAEGLSRATVGLLRGARAAVTRTQTEHVYQLVNEKGLVVYYGIADSRKQLLDRLRDHAVTKRGQFSGMQVLARGLSHDQARTLEGTLIRARLAKARAAGKLRGLTSVDDQLAAAGLLNKNRGRIMERFISPVPTVSTPRLSILPYGNHSGLTY